MDIVQLQYFQMLAKTQHMTKAAGILNVAQSALSRSLRNLESELDLKLFDRIGKHIYLNENGQILLRHTEAVLRELADARSELDDRRGREAQTVTLSMYAGSKLLPDLIRGFKDRHPDISLRLIQQGSLHEDLYPSDITVYSSGSPPERPSAVVLMEEEICLALPADHPLGHGESIRLSDVSNQPFICLHKGKGLRAITDELCHQAGFIPNIILESDSPATVRDLISVGVGLAFVPRISWRGMDSDPSVTLVQIQQPRCSRFVIMEWEQTRYFSKAASQLRDYLVAFFKQAAQCDTP